MGFLRDDTGLFRADRLAKVVFLAGTASCAGGALTKVWGLVGVGVILVLVSSALNALHSKMVE